MIISIIIILFILLVFVSLFFLTPNQNRLPKNIISVNKKLTTANDYKVKDKKIYKYFLKGFNLVNRNIEIYIFSAALSCIIYIFPHQRGLINLILFLPRIFLLFLSVGYSLSIPIFLVKKQNKINVDLNFIWNQSLSTAIRIILPFIVYGFIFLILLFFYIGIVLQLSGVDVTKSSGIIEGMKLIIQRPYIYFLPISWIGVLFVFFPMFFTLEMNGFHSSVKKSIIMSFQNLKFAFILWLVGYLVLILLSVIFPINNIPVNSSFNIYRILFNLCINYTQTVITASILLYYQQLKR